MPLYVFFDESGDLNFNPSGSRYYFFGALTTNLPTGLTVELTSLRYQLYDEGLDLEYFHATEDRQAVRDRVFDVIQNHGNFEFDAIIIEKAKANPVLYEPQRFYLQFAQYLLDYVFNRHRDNDDRIVLITDRIPVKKKRKAIEKAFKTYLSRKLGHRSYSIMHHTSASHACLQAVDYCMWAVQRKWHRGDERSYVLINKFVRSEFDIFKSGGYRYY